MAELLGVATERCGEFERHVRYAAAGYLRLRHAETAPRPGTVHRKLEKLVGVLNDAASALARLDDACRQALIHAADELPSRSPVTADGDLLQQVQDGRRRLRNLLVVAKRAAREHQDRRGRPTKKAIRDFVWHLASIYESFSGRRPAQRGNLLKFVEQATHPIDPVQRYAGLENVVREIVTRRKK